MMLPYWAIFLVVVIGAILGVTGGAVVVSTFDPQPRLGVYPYSTPKL